ncbi:uncharacterized protein LOC135833191 [Planococcus citri]|uniref:uncharacterized protein LOC135833191 n=1 Tax=Planococcus citri TaxID=170843 RepID=UPI0031F788A7
MNFQSLEGCKQRIRRNQPTGTLMLALNTREENFRKASVRVAKSRIKLHETKTKLQKAIAEYKKLEREVNQQKAQCERSVQQTEAAIEESLNPSYDKSDGDEVILWNCSTFLVRPAKKLIEHIDEELSEMKLIDSSAENLKKEHLNSVTPVPFSVIISNIDLSGSIQRCGVAKLNNTKKCCICMKNEINSIFYTCKHECCCIDCATNFAKNGRMKCPICQCFSRRVVKTYVM